MIKFIAITYNKLVALATIICILYKAPTKSHYGHIEKSFCYSSHFIQGSSGIPSSIIILCPKFGVGPGVEALKTECYNSHKYSQSS